MSASAVDRQEVNVAALWPEDHLEISFDGRVFMDAFVNKVQHDASKGEECWLLVANLVNGAGQTIGVLSSWSSAGKKYTRIGPSKEPQCTCAYGDGRTCAVHLGEREPAEGWKALYELDTDAKTWAIAAATLNDRADMWEREGNRPCEMQECRNLANAFRTYAEGVGVPSHQSLRERRDEARAQRDEALTLLAELRASKEEK